MITDEQVAHFWADGYTTIEPLVEGAPIDEMRDVYDRILRREIDLPTDRELGGVTRQIMVPSQHVPAIRDNATFRNAEAVARRLLGVDDVEHLFDMMIFKPAGHPVPTPWHQDLGYFRMPFMYAGTLPKNYTVQLWIALDDVDVETGCMHFVPGAHDKPMPEHFIYSGDDDYEGRLLAIRDPEVALDLDRAVACPLTAGGATVHVEGTPHYTPPNISPDRDRRAYIVNFRRPGDTY